MESQIFLDRLLLKIRRMGQLRQVPLTTKQTEEGSNERLNFAVSSMCGWRPFMEDAHIANPNFTKNCSLFAVFDGHGGSQVSIFAKKFFEKKLLKNKNFINKKYQTALHQTFQSLDQKLQTQEGIKEIMKIKLEIAEKQNILFEEGPLDSGCTAVVCLITDKEIYCANAGDSRCVIYREKTVENMSEDHKPDDIKQLKRIVRAGGVVDFGRINGSLNLSRGFGDFQFKGNKKLKWEEQMVIAKPDIIKKPLCGTQYIVLRCDGIFQQKTNKEIMNMVRHKPDEALGQTAEGILQQLLAQNSQQQCGLDNMSLIIIKMK